MQYDTVATLAAIPRLRKEFFSPTIVTGMHGVKHCVVGCSETKHSVIDVEKLGEFLKRGFVSGISLNNQRRVQFILLTQPGWSKRHPHGDNRCDDLLSIVVLRTLFELAILDCVGVVVSPGPDMQDEFLDEDIHDQAEEMKKMLRQLGMAHVNVHVADHYTTEDKKKRAGYGAGSSGVVGADILKELYKKVSPAGISLIITGSCGEVAEFAHTESSEFQQKTQNIIHLGGAYPQEDASGQTTLKPDLEAGNNKSDIESARRFYRKCQELLVPMIIISRHCARMVQFPRKLFDNLEMCGGEIGKRAKAVQVSCIGKLYTAACTDPEEVGRRGLPLNCNQKWFCDTFCGGKTPKENKADMVFEACEVFEIYSLLAVLVALPPVLNTYIEPKATVVRSVKHLVIGSNENDSGLKDVEGLMALIYQCLFSGTRLNNSSFKLDEPPDIPLASGKKWKWRKHTDALSWMLPGPNPKLWDVPRD
jgi:hypothetical protein